MSINNVMKGLIFEHFIPILWEPGHMGTFLANFLTSESVYSIALSKQGGMLDNKEWFFVDCFHNFFGSHNKYYNILKTVSFDYPGIEGVELIEIIAFEIVKSNYQYLTKKNDLTFEILKNNSSRYIKEHPYQEGPYAYDKVTWKNKKICCRFPYNKIWIPYFLLKYKYGSADPEFIQITKNHLERLDYPYPDIRPLHNNNDYITFDIYDLIFNKNLDQVYSIDPSFNYNDDKKSMLDLAHNSSLEILELFGLDFNWNIDSNTKTKDVLAQQKKDPGFFKGRN
jgi:hypothetical protein